MKTFKPTNNIFEYRYLYRSFLFQLSNLCCCTIFLKQFERKAIPFIYFVLNKSEAFKYFLNLLTLSL